jgi:hypothetical protein
MLFTYRGRFLNCPEQRAVWVGGGGKPHSAVAVRSKFTSYRQGRGERYEVNLLCTATPIHIPRPRQLQQNSRLFWVQMALAKLVAIITLFRDLKDLNAAILTLWSCKI